VDDNIINLNITRENLEEMKTITRSQSDDLKYETVGFRVWVRRGTGMQPVMVEIWNPINDEWMEFGALLEGEQNEED